MYKEFESFVKLKHPNFVFRKRQKEVIEDIIRSYEKNQNGVYLLDAPTGSGKSIIAMLFAQFMASKDKNGYILTSDLSLHDQYARDFDSLKLNHWGLIKGVDNYECSLNLQKFSIGECKNKGLSYQEAAKLNCYKNCGYFQAREKAIESNVALLTYSYALIQRNYVEDKMQNGSPFEQRDFVVCDEAHKVVDIVQGHFSPRISRNTHEVLVKLQANLNGIGFTDALINIEKLKELVEAILLEENKDVLLSYLKRVMAIIGKALSYRDNVSKRAKELFGEHQVPKEWQNTFKGFDHCKDVHCKIEDYIEIIEKSGLDYMIKNPISPDEVVFNCLDEHYLMKKHFFSKFGFVLMMTATMGSKKDFEKGLGIKNAFYHKMESTFDYSKSPIHYYPSRRMSMKDMPNNFDWLVKKVSDILEFHPNESGVIHSGSYELANRIYQKLDRQKKHRVMLYKGTEEKTTALNSFVEKPGHLIMGPSLLEGLNLDGEKSRLQIFVKVPYPNIGDRYVSAKMKYSREWYTWKACTSILQGIGRSVRSENDWAVTYFLDGCLTDLLMGSSDNFPEEFVSRIKICET